MDANKFFEDCQNEDLIAGGFDPSKLTDRQKGLILQPSHAPENYFCDGEIGIQQARTRWLLSMKSSGLTPDQIVKAKRMNGF